MKNPISNTIFDSRELIEWKEYLESELVDQWNEYHEDEEDHEEIDDFDDVDLDHEHFREVYEDTIDDYEQAKSICEQLEGYGDFDHGEAIIHEEYFNEYCQQICEDVEPSLKELPAYIENHIDWDGVADEMQQDYTTADYDGTTYYMRS